jgi:hypothetical protein
MFGIIRNYPIPTYGSIIEHEKLDKRNLTSAPDALLLQGTRSWRLESEDPSYRITGVSALLSGASTTVTKAERKVKQSAKSLFVRRTSLTYTHWHFMNKCSTHSTCIPDMLPLNTVLNDVSLNAFPFGRCGTFVTRIHNILPGEEEWTQKYRRCFDMICSDMSRAHRNVLSILLH